MPVTKVSRRLWTELWFKRLLLPSSLRSRSKVTTRAFVGTYLVRLPATGLLDSRMPHVAGRVHQEEPFSALHAAKESM